MEAKMSKKCDNTSVAVIVRDPDCRNSSLDRILLIERKIYNPGFALPAGHHDGADPKKAAKNELFEEVGLTALYLLPRLIKTLKNTCKREGGTFHRWIVFEAEKWSGEPAMSEREVKSFVWADKAKIAELARKLEEFISKNGFSLEDLPALIDATNKSEEWKSGPGLEPAMYVLFKELKII